MDSTINSANSIFKTFYHNLIYVISVLWALFQLSLPQFIILDQITIRAIHLSFALIIVFLVFPLNRKKQKDFTLGLQFHKARFVNILLALFGAASILYIVIDWNGIAMRLGIPILRDMIIGCIAIFILFEASRRVIGPALAIVALFFTLYAFIGPYLPDVFAFKGVSLRKYLSQVFLSTEGIYGIPLGVSASIVYLFVLMGALLEKAGAGQFFIKLALSVLGRFRGGPAKSAVLASGLMGTISGSSVANIVTTGTFTIPLMKKVGYPAKKAAAIEVAASTDGQLMPPIMGAAAFIIAEYVNVPYIEVIKAAAIPALISYGALFYITHLEACKLGIESIPKEQLPSLRKTMKEGFHFLAPIAVLLFELLILRHSPELSAFRAIIALILIIFYQSFVKAKNQSYTRFGAIKKTVADSFKIIAQGCISGSRNMVSVAVATAVAGVIVGIVNLGIGGMITNIVEILSGGNILLLLIITAVACLLLGMGLPTTATYIVMASLIAPVIVEIGSKYGLAIPLIGAHLFCFYFGILADDTPPVGLASYAAAAIAGSEPIPTGIQGFLYDLRTAIIPFMFVLNPDLLLFRITNPFQIILIFLMSLLAALVFTSAVQGWFISRNRWNHTLLLLLSSFMLFYPGFFIKVLNLNLSYRYFFYLFGIVLLFIAYAGQRIALKKENELK
jgi:TRAP transporter 4TM/12TM fusion protein